MNIKFIELQQLPDIINQSDWVIIDIRDMGSYKDKRIKKAKHISTIDLNSLDKESKILVACYHGHRSQIATFQLQEQGFKNVHSLVGGIEAAKKENLE